MDDFSSFAGEVLEPISAAIKDSIIPALTEALGLVRSAFREVTGYTEAITQTGGKAGRARRTG
jgi:hypothetical protein